jgi:hypothetical protein
MYYIQVKLKPKINNKVVLIIKYLILLNLLNSLLDTLLTSLETFKVTYITLLSPNIIIEKTHPISQIDIMINSYFTSVNNF